MSSLTIWHWLIVLGVVALVFGTTRLSRPEDAVRMPVYSAEATNGKEAEFIRDRLPNRFQTVAAVALAVFLCAAVWWLTR